MQNIENVPIRNSFTSVSSLCATAGRFIAAVQCRKHLLVSVGLIWGGNPVGIRLKHSLVKTSRSQCPIVKARICSVKIFMLRKPTWPLRSVKIHAMQQAVADTFREAIFSRSRCTYREKEFHGTYTDFAVLFCENSRYAHCTYSNSIDTFGQLRMVKADSFVNVKTALATFRGPRTSTIGKIGRSMYMCVVAWNV